MTMKVYKTTFVAGEISPRMGSRIDVAAYENAASSLSNWRPLVQGGITRRPGLKVIADLTGLSTGNIHGEHFLFNTDQAYVVFFAAGRADFFLKDGTVAGTITGAPWTDSMIPELYATQRGDTMFVTHEDMQPQVIKRTGATTFTRTAFTFETHSSGYPIYQPYYKYADSAMTITPSATTGSITLTTSAAYWTASHVGMKVRVESKTCTITGYTSTTVVNATVNETLGGTAATTDWDVQSFNAVDGWPKTCLLFNQRLLFGGSKGLPNWLFASKVSAYYNFDVGTAQDNEAIVVSIEDDHIAEIVGMEGLRDLQIFTSHAEIYVPITDTKPFTPSNITFKEETAFGSAKLRPQRFDGGVLFLTRQRATLREFSFSDIRQSFEAPALSYLASHLIKNPIAMTSQIEGANQTESYIYLLNNDGTITLFHSARSEKIAAFAPWSTDGTIKAISGVDGEVFVVVDRQINGGTKRYVEQFVPTMTVDSGKTLTDTPKSIWPGFEHLAGETVQVMSNYDYLGEFTMPVDGILDLGELTPSTVTVGLNYTPTLTPLPPDLQLRSGPTTGDPRRIVRVILDLVEAYNVDIDGSDLLIRQGGDDISQPISPVTGLREFWLLGWDLRGQPTVTQTVPLPLTINGMVMEVDF